MARNKPRSPQDWEYLRTQIRRMYEGGAEPAQIAAALEVDVTYVRDVGCAAKKKPVLYDKRIEYLEHKLELLRGVLLDVVKRVMPDQYEAIANRLRDNGALDALAPLPGKAKLPPPTLRAKLLLARNGHQSVPPPAGSLAP